MFAVERLDAILRTSLRKSRARDLAGAALPWKEVVGETVAAHSKPRSLRRGVLLVATTSPAWAQQLSFLREDIKSRVNEYLGENAVREVRMEGGRLPQVDA